MKAMIAVLFLFATVCIAQDDAVVTAEKKYEAAVEQAKKELIATLKGEMTRLTKAGDLDAALKIRDRLASLEVPKTIEKKDEIGVDGNYVAHNPDWNGTVELMLDGKFVSTGVKNPNGKWEFDGKKLTLKWDHWPAESLEVDGNGDFHGKRTNLKKTAGEK